MDKAALMQYRDVDRELRGIEESIARLRARMESPLMSVLSEAPKGSRAQRDRMADIVAKVIELEALYTAKWDELIDVQTQIEAAIEKLPAQQRRVLRMRYLEGLGWKEIARKAAYDERHCRRICAAGEKRLG